MPNPSGALHFDPSKLGIDRTQIIRCQDEIGNATAVNRRAHTRKPVHRLDLPANRVAMQPGRTGLRV